MKTRQEKDALGTVSVPINSYGGSFSVRAKKNFQISNLRAYPSFSWALALIKRSSAKVNGDLGLLSKKQASAIIQAAEEFMSGRFQAEFDLDIYQAGAGTPFNMNMNEILANRANEILGGKKGDYRFVHPNDHVNLGQSSNDVIPTALRLAALIDIRPFLEQGVKLQSVFQKKSVQFKNVLKVGRTHLQDAVPVTLGQELEAYSVSLAHALARVKMASKELRALGIGATAVGTGINSHLQFKKRMCEELSHFLNLSFVSAHLFENNHSMAVFLNLSSSLRGLATELIRICNDLRLMASGPDAGFNEIQLPEVEPGSSLMPGKVNPSVLECMLMICTQVLGLDAAIALAAQKGEFELNWYTPLLSWDLLHQIEILSNGMEMLRKNCIQGLKANEKEMKATLNRSTALATGLFSFLSYYNAAELVKRAKKTGKPFSNLVPKNLRKYLKADHLTKPNRV